MTKKMSEERCKVADVRSGLGKFFVMLPKLMKMVEGEMKGESL